MVNFDDDGEKSDKIFLVVEVASLHTRKQPTQRAKAEVAKQLHDYMVMLGEEGARWENEVHGVGILGTEVCFSYPRRRNGVITFTKPSKWHDLYDGTFWREMNKLAEIHT